MAAFDPSGMDQAAAAGLGAGSRDVLLAGTHGALLGQAQDLLLGAMQLRYGSVVQVPILGSDATEPSGDGCVRLFVGDLVTADWAERVRSGELPAVLVVDDVRRACAHLCKAGFSDIEVIRTLVGVAISLGDLCGRGRVLTVARGAWADPDAVASRMLAHLGLPSAAPGAVLSANDSEPDVSDSLRSLIDSVAAPAFEFAVTGRRQAILWPRESLFWGDRPGEQAPRVLDMTGPARVLAYGPYYPVPSGRWTVRVTLAFSPSSRGVPLALEMHGTERLGRFEFKAEQPGVFAASFPVVVPSAREALEVRLCMDRGAIEGTIGLDRIELIPENDQSVA